MATFADLGGDGVASNALHSHQITPETDPLRVQFLRRGRGWCQVQEPSVERHEAREFLEPAPDEHDLREDLRIANIQSRVLHHQEASVGPKRMLTHAGRHSEGGDACLNRRSKSSLHRRQSLSAQRQLDSTT